MIEADDDEAVTCADMSRAALEVRLARLGALNDQPPLHLVQVQDFLRNLDPRVGYDGALRSLVDHLEAWSLKLHDRRGRPLPRWDVPSGPMPGDDLLVPASDVRMPEAVRELRERPVSALWVAGNQALLGEGIRIGIVGSRTPRGDSTAVAAEIARGAARAGCTVVSGLARGVDTIAHKACLAAGGRTIGVLAGGLGMMYPKSNLPLARRIVGVAQGEGLARIVPDAPGALVSEYGACDQQPQRWRFQHRNRLIAALSHFVVIVQAAGGSGSIGTADAASELGIPVGVAPGVSADSAYAGSVELIREGADCVASARSLLLRLESNGVARQGFADAHRETGAILLADGSWRTPGADAPGAGEGNGAGHAGATGRFGAAADHPLASILSTPRTTDQVCDLAGLELRDARRLLYELEDDGAVIRTQDGCWLAT